MSFNFIAKYYTPLSTLVFGNTLEIAKTSLYNEVSDTAHILFIGGGTGVSLKTLVQLKPKAQINFVESSEQMILQSKKKVNYIESVTFFNEPIEFFAGKNYDVVITEFFLDLFTKKKIENLIATILLKLNHDGCWINTDFKATGRIRHKWMLNIMYFFFRITSKVKTKKLIEIKPIMVANKFFLKKENRFNSGFITSSLFVRS